MRTRSRWTLRIATAMLLAAAATVSARGPVSCPTRVTPDACLAKRFSGVVVIVRHGETVLRDAYGVADATTGEPNRLEHRFRIGSVSKTFTGAAIHQLAARGTIQLDAPVRRAWPSFPGDAQTTVRALLDHQSGLNDFSQAQWKTLLLAPPDRDGRLRLALGVKRDRPGAFRYSNPGYVLLGRLIEEVTGESWESVVHRDVIEALGLTATGIASDDAGISNFSVGHDARGRRDATPYRYDAIAPAGGLYSTADDLVRWARAATDPARQSAAFFAEPSGWARGERFGRRALWHDGLTNTHAAFVLRFRDEDSLIVAVSNRGGRDGRLGPLVRSLAAHYFTVVPGPADRVK